MILQLNMPDKLHGRTAELVRNFAEEMAEKLLLKQTEYDLWPSAHWEKDCRHEMLMSVTKGDPLDVANYCAFMWFHGWRTFDEPVQLELSL